MSNVFNDFSNRLNDIAVEWPSDKTALKSEPATREAFEEAATLSLLRLKASDPDRFTRFKLDDADAGAHYSMKMMNRFLFLSSIAAAKNGYTVTDFISIANHPETVDLMITLSKHFNKVAGRSEGEFNLKDKRQNYYSDDMLAAEEMYDTKNGHVVIKGFNTTVTKHALHVDAGLREDHPPEVVDKMHAGKGCHAEKAGALIPIYKSLVLIGLKDSSLATAVMSLGRESLLPKPKEKPQQIAVTDFLLSQDPSLA